MLKNAKRLKKKAAIVLKYDNPMVPFFFFPNEKIYITSRTLIYLQQISEFAAGEIVSNRNFLRPLARGNTNKHFLMATFMFIVGFKVQLVLEFYFIICIWITARLRKKNTS